ncbi:hypothetical protein [Maricaulis maris]|uniref:hypothetical protein n=1 Tax=Maricaulis maris TaxID=74318 RepID=UPI003B8BDF13
MRPGFRDHWHYHMRGMTPWRWLKLAGIVVLVVAVSLLIWSQETYWIDKTRCGVVEATVIQSAQRPRASKWYHTDTVQQQLAETGTGERFMIARPDMALQVGDPVALQLWCDGQGETMFLATSAS